MYQLEIHCYLGSEKIKVLFLTLQQLHFQYLRRREVAKYFESKKKKKLRCYLGVLLLLFSAAILQLCSCKDVTSLEDFLALRLDTVDALFNLVSAHKRVLVNFYNASDLYSRLADFEFCRAAQVVHANPKYTTKLAVFDLTNKSNNADVVSLAKEYEIKAGDYPHLRYFVDHDLHKARRYDGSRHENGMIKWVQLQEETPVFAISNVDIWRQFIKAHDHTLIAYIPPNGKQEEQYKEFLATFERVAQAHRKWNDTPIGFGVVYQSDRIVPMQFPQEYKYRRNRDDEWLSLDNCNEEEELDHIAQNDPYVYTRTSLQLQMFFKPRVILYQKMVNPYHIRYHKDIKETEFVSQRSLQDKRLFDDLMGFIEQETLPLVEEINGINYQRYMKYHNPEVYQRNYSNYKTMVWIALEDMSDPNELPYIQDAVSFYYDLAQRYKHRGLLFAMIDFRRFPEHIRMLGIPFVPGLLIVHGPNKFLYPPQQSIISAPHVHDFFSLFFRDMLPVHRIVPDTTHDGKTTFGNEAIKPVRASVEVPLPVFFGFDGTLEFRYGVYVVNGRNVDKALIAWNAHAHILMCYYLESDRTSRQFLLELQKIAKHLSQEDWLKETNHSTPTIAMQINCEYSDCPEIIETFPHIRFYAKNSIHSFIGGIGASFQVNHDNANDIRFYKGGAGLHYSGVLNAFDVIDSLKNDLLQRNL
ncbi:hypothetical protein RFI_21151 [Reticulomyxa filosa]|uniref:Thioredoxin domain-containing protein n=1 Tax=Reticulomyxa filosa TaxID=46433 RepID=X6MQR2_RETFI|nr:hypothetical protein RFI_21151 [Reticulomyxa filosa]|eukprot:ETO16204.1 hypothetical protein RFI_21151 [Reticulomyxa filosa]